jgi:hypothetical protein
VHVGPDFLVLRYGQDPDFQDYYYRYKDAYDAMATDPACASVNDTSGCPTNIFSNFPPNQTDDYAWYLNPPCSTSKSSPLQHYVGHTRR